MAVEPCGHGQHLAETAPALAATHIVNIWRGMMADPLKDLVDASVSIWLDDPFMLATGVRNAATWSRRRRWFS